MTTDRYVGRPLLILLDSYILDALGALDEKTARNCEAMAPKIIASLNVSAASWQEAVERALAIPPESINELRALWEHHVHETIAQGETPDVLSWSRHMADRQFGLSD